MSDSLPLVWFRFLKISRIIHRIHLLLHFLQLTSELLYCLMICSDFFALRYRQLIVLEYPVPQHLSHDPPTDVSSPDHRFTATYFLAGRPPSLTFPHRKNPATAVIPHSICHLPSSSSSPASAAGGNDNDNDTLRKTDIRQMKAWPYRQECRGRDTAKKNLLCR